MPSPSTNSTAQALDLKHMMPLIFNSSPQRGGLYRPGTKSRDWDGLPIRVLKGRFMLLHRFNTIHRIRQDPSPHHMKRPFRTQDSFSPNSRDFVPGWYEMPPWGREPTRA